VYCTLGTWFGERTDVFEVVLAGLADEDVNVVVTVGRAHDPRTLGAVPPNARIERYLFHPHVMPRCAAVVCHGGFLTMVDAMRYGLPVVALPLGADHGVNALASVARGTGLRLDPPDLTPEAVRQAVRRVLDEPTFRQRAQDIGAEIEAMPSASEAVPALEALAGG
jgi:MGT family glycosyltransferase